MDGFVDIYNTETGIKGRVPAHFLDDPILGRNIRKTPSQRALDGELGQAPTTDSTIAEIRRFADDADIDVAGLSLKAELLERVQAVVGTDPLPEPVLAGDVDVQPNVDPELAAGIPPEPDVIDTDLTTVDVDTPTSPDGTEPSDNSAADAGQE